MPSIPLPAVIAGQCKAVIVVQEQGRSMPAALNILAAVQSNGVRIQRSCLFSDEVISHVKEVLFRQAQRFVFAQGIQMEGIALSFQLPTSLALHDEKILCSGHSADLAITLAMISAALQIPLRQDVALTGQLKADSHEVGMVKGLADKVQLNDPAVQIIAIPDWKADSYFAQLYPSEYAQVRLATKTSKNRLVTATSLSETLSFISRESHSPLEAFFQTEPVGAQENPTSNGIYSYDTTYEVIITQLLFSCSEAELNRQIDRPINERYATFGVRINSVQNWQECLASVGTLMTHLQLPGDFTHVTQTLSQAFSEVGGSERALNIAKDPAQGGLRQVYHQVITHLLRKHRELYLEGVFFEALNPLDSHARLQVVRTLLARMHPLLPQDMVLAPVEFLANRPQELVKAILAIQKHLSMTFSR